MNNAESTSRRPSDDEIARAVPPVARVREIRVGIFVILGLAGFFVILFMMTSPATFRGRYTVLTHVDDAGGMRSGDAVTMRGVHIGRVRAFDLTQETGVLLSLEIERGWRIPLGSRTEVRSTGFLGGMVVAVVTGPGPGFVEPGTLLPGETVGGVLEVAGDLSGDAVDALARFRTLLSDSTIAGTEGMVAAARDLFSPCGRDAGRHRQPGHRSALPAGRPEAVGGQRGGRDGRRGMGQCPGVGGSDVGEPGALFGRVRGVGCVVQHHPGPHRAGRGHPRASSRSAIRSTTPTPIWR